MQILNRIMGVVGGLIAGVLAGLLYFAFIMQRLWMLTWTTGENIATALLGMVVLTIWAVVPAVVMFGFISLKSMYLGVTQGWLEVAKFLTTLKNDPLYPFGRDLFADEEVEEKAIKASNNSLYDATTKLTAAKKINFLTSQEIAIFKLRLHSEQNAVIANRQQLKEYQQYVKGRCAICLTDIKSLSAPLTVEANFVNRNSKKSRSYTYTYERDELLKHIQFSGKMARVPQNNLDLLADSQHIKIYSGVAKKIILFIEHVRLVNRYFLRSQNIKKRQVLLSKPSDYLNRSGVFPAARNIVTKNLRHSLSTYAAVRRAPR
jgi:hypothetical protein